MSQPLNGTETVQVVVTMPSSTRQRIKIVAAQLGVTMQDFTSTAIINSLTWAEELVQEGRGEDWTSQPTQD